MKQTAAIATILIMLITLTACDPYRNYTQEQRRGIVPPVEEGLETIEEQVVYDKDGIKVTMLALRTVNFGGYRLFASVENKTKENILAQFWDTSLNGIMVSSGVPFTLLVEAGRKGQDETSIYMHHYGLDELGITTFLEFEFYLHIVNADTMEIIDHTEAITIKSSAYGEEQKYDDEGRTVFEAGKIRVVERELVMSVSENTPTFDSMDIYFLSRT